MGNSGGTSSRGEKAIVEAIQASAKSAAVTIDEGEAEGEEKQLETSRVETKTAKKRGQKNAEEIALEIKASSELAEVITPNKILLTEQTNQLRLDKLEDDLKRERDLHGLRKTFLNRLFGLILGWLVAVVICVFLCAVGGEQQSGDWNCPFTFKLPDSVLIAFISSTTVSVLGLFLIAAKWLFPSKQNGDHEHRTKEREPHSRI